MQGVGFRPFIYRLAHEENVTGSVKNRASGVEIYAQAQADTLARFIHRIRAEQPPLAAITELSSDPVECMDLLPGFSICSSEGGDLPEVDIARDTTLCADCLQEMNDPENRRFRHPFINCTNCGPRYTLIRSLPYDRDKTTMAVFPMCPACRKEYEDPSDRRFHAQPNCCPNCGPTLSFCNAHGIAEPTPDPIKRAIKQLSDGRIIAIKGIGGFHLACRADDDAAIRQLRLRKHREEKPFALMVPNAETAERFCAASPAEKRMLEGIERPIVLLVKKEHTLPESIAPGMTTLGLMLPYAPLHHLLFQDTPYSALVMTSANRSNTPLCHKNEEAIERLAGIADGFLLHDRDIHVPVDDSIVREIDHQPIMLRRARGYVPAPLHLPFSVDGIVALGGIMKSTIAIGRGNNAYVSQYLGTADSLETLDHADAVSKHLLDVLSVTPRIHAIDSHPGGLQERLITPKEEIIKVQHHHAHAAACMAENNINSPTLCVVFDGLGLGDDGHIWGGEILIADFRGYRRVAQLTYMPMPGGDAATRFPGRMALGALNHSADDLLHWIPTKERTAIQRLVEHHLNCPLTSSMGRLFDAMAALLDLCREQTFEGQAAMRLEGLADPNETASYPVHIDFKDERWFMDGPALLQHAVEDIRNGVSAAQVSARFHHSIAAMTATTIQHIIETALPDAKQVCCSGGCFQNALLVKSLKTQLSKRGLETILHRRLSPGDECISFGQLVVAAHHHSTQGEASCA